MFERIRQFRAALTPPAAADFALAEAHLSRPLLALFEAQHPRDIVHSAATARWLLERGHDEPELIAGALLHDIGKGDQRRRDRVAHVVGSAVGAGKLLAREQSRFALRRAMARSRGHSASGARLLNEAGASERLIELTASHHDAPGDDRVLALLQQADALN